MIKHPHFKQALFSVIFFCAFGAGFVAGGSHKIDIGYVILGMTAVVMLSGRLGRYLFGGDDRYLGLISSVSAMMAIVIYFVLADLSRLTNDIAVIGAMAVFVITSAVLFHWYPDTGPDVDDSGTRDPKFNPDPTPRPRKSERPRPMIDG